MDVRVGTIRKAEHWRIDASELWCWRLLRVPWTARRSNQSILKEISPEYSLEGLMLKLRLQYFGHLIQRSNSLEKTLMLGKIEAGGGDNRGWDSWMASPNQWTWVGVNSGSWWWTRRLWSAAVHGVTKSWTRLSNWTDWQRQKACMQKSIRYWWKKLKIQTDGDIPCSWIGRINIV